MCRQKQRWAEYSTGTLTPERLKLDQLEMELETAERNGSAANITAAKSRLKAQERIVKKSIETMERYQVHYQRSLFHLGVTLAHECFHLLTGLWTGFGRARTPERFGSEFASEEDQDYGEAGQWWEYRHGFDGLGSLAWGIKDKKKDDPYALDDDTLSAGIPFIRTLANGGTWTRISTAYIQDVIRTGKSTSGS
jgi:hypothetical protein